MFNPGDQVIFYSSVAAINVTMTVRYIVRTKAGGENVYLCCYLDSANAIQQIEALESELTPVP